MKRWSKFWKSSKKPGKQRKYRYNAPNHIKQKFLTSPLSKTLRKEHKKRNTIINVGDVVKIVRGEFKGKEGKVERVNTSKGTVHIEKVVKEKIDGTKVSVGINASKVMITKLNLEDKLRKKKFEVKK